MNKPIVFDGETHREMTETEFKAWQQLNDEIKQRKIIEQNIFDKKQAAKQSAQTKLAALGLSEEEIAALVG